MLYYKIKIYPKAQKDIKRISKYMEEYNGDKVIRKIYNDIDNLIFMPRIHKTIFYYTKPELEYRRLVSGKYIIIYEIKEKQINILRIFNQKENYLNQRKFILREENKSYFIDKRRNNMIKFRTLKNSYAKLKENFTHTITEEEYVCNILEEAVEKLNSGKAVFYTHEEFWKLVREKEEEDYRKEVSHNIRSRYA